MMAIFKSQPIAVASTSVQYSRPCAFLWDYMDITDSRNIFIELI